MRTQLEKLSPVLVELQVEVPANTVAAQVNQAYDELRKRARVRGFRPGKAPRHVLVHLYAPAVHADVAKKLVDSSLPNALKVENTQTLFTAGYDKGQELSVPVAHHDGNYFADDATLDRHRSAFSGARFTNRIEDLLSDPDLDAWHLARHLLCARGNKQGMRPPIPLAVVICPRDDDRGRGEVLEGWRR